jgi:FtsZ-interacting cell division protein ZipA
VLRNRGATPFSSSGMREFSTRGLTLALDVPRAPRAAFPAMRALGTALCEALQGTIADEQGRILDEPALDRVGAQLNAIHDRLEASGIVPGGALALRLFA